MHQEEQQAEILGQPQGLPIGSVPVKAHILMQMRVKLELVQALDSMSLSSYLILTKPVKSLQYAKAASFHTLRLK